MKPPPAKVTGAERTRPAIFLDTRMNDSFRAVNRLLGRGRRGAAADEAVRRQSARRTPAGTFFIRRTRTTRPLAGEDRRRARHAVPRHRGHAPRGRHDRAQAGPRRPVGPLRRLDAGRVDADAARTVRVPVQGRLPAATRSRRACAKCSTCIIFVDGAIPGRGGAGGFRPKGPDRKDAHSRGVSRTVGERHGRRDRAALEGVPEGRRHDRHDRQFDEPRVAHRPAGRRSSRDEGRGGEGTAARPRQVLRPRLAPSREGGHRQRAGVGRRCPRSM